MGSQVTGGTGDPKEPYEEKQSKSHLFWRVQWFWAKNICIFKLISCQLFIICTSAPPFGAFSPQHRSTKGIIEDSLPHFFSATVSPEVSWGKSRLLMFVCLLGRFKTRGFWYSESRWQKEMIRGGYLKFWLLIDHHPTVDGWSPANQLIGW